MNEIILRDITQKEFQEIENLNYYTCSEGKDKYDLHFFCCVFENEKKLFEKYEDINNIIAYNFQNVLNTKIEKWNVYLFFFVKSKISKQSKIIIEQNKYATRKIIFENFIGDSIIEEQLNKIKERILVPDLKFKIEPDKLSVTPPQVESSMESLLGSVRGKTNNQKKEKIHEFIEGVINES